MCLKHACATDRCLAAWRTRWRVFAVALACHCRALRCHTGEPGKAVQLSQQQLQVSQEVCMLGFPLAVDKDLGSKEHPTSMPTVTRGQVVAISFPTGELAAADYSGGELCSVLPKGAVRAGVSWVVVVSQL